MLYGGRGGAKSWGVARALLIEGCQRSLRILCAREIQKTIADSVHRLLTDQIVALGLLGQYHWNDTKVWHDNGTEFIFAGLRDQDAAKIKSYEGVDRVWCEEAHAITKKSWNILIPTIRKEGSEIWVTFNPELDTDETWKRFVENPPPDAVVVKLTYRDNPWFPAVLEAERLHMQRTDPDEYEHVWEGVCHSVLPGAIYAKEVQAMIETKRIRNVPYQPGLFVHTVWDLGWNDSTAIILVQRLHSEVRVIGYIEDSQRRLDEYVAMLARYDYAWGHDWLPHDADQHDIKSGTSVRKMLREMKRSPKIMPKSDVETGIKAARLLFPRLYVDSDNCERLMECLKRYRRRIPTNTNEPATPIHDEYSHGADALRGLAAVVDVMKNEDDNLKIQTYVTAKRGVVGGGSGWMGA